MKIVLFGASGMVGRGVLRECLLADDVTEIVSVVRKRTGTTDPKLREVVHADFTDFTALDGDFTGVDGWFFCLGVSAAGMSEDAYRAITYDVTVAAATALIGHSPDAAFVYVSGQGTNSTGRAMWARVKGATEDALFALSEHAYAFRPGFIRPMHGESPKSGFYRVAYVILRPLSPLLARATKHTTSTVAVGQAMLAVARTGYPTRILENRDINATS